MDCDAANNWVKTYWKNQDKRFVSNRVLKSAAQWALRSERRSLNDEREGERRSAKKIRSARGSAAQ